ncbi:MAG: two-component regulator propeller domain-containing protein [Flavisolibacter sp.]
MRTRILLFFLFPLSAFGQNTFPALGMWREHLPYASTIDVAASSRKIYAATPYSLFSVDLASHETERISKVSGLSETGISTIAFDRIAEKLYVAYSNSNVDVIDENGIHNIPELQRENISGDKTIYHISPDNDQCYLSTGLGIIVIDAMKYEIKESWFIGNSGGNVKTNGFARSNGFNYAATEEGLKKNVGGTNPADFHNWLLLSGTNGLAPSSAKDVVNLSSRIIVLQNDSLFVENGNSWTLFFTNGWPIVSINVSENKLLVCQRLANGDSKVVVLNSDGSVSKTLKQSGVISFPQKAVLANGEPWIADRFGGLSHWTGNSSEVFKLNSPFDIAFGGMTVFNHKFYATSGTVNDSWNYQFNRSGIYGFADGEWTNINQFSYPVLDSLMDFITVAVDPRDETVWAGSYGGGLLHIKPNNQLEIFKQNSPIGPTIGDPTSFRVSGLAFDMDNNLWISNFGSDRQLHVLKNDGTWRSFTAPFLLNQDAVSQIVVDDAGQKWIVSPMSNGLIVFNDNNTIDNINDDRWMLYRAGTSQGNLPSNEVSSIAKDKSGFIWVGTSDGIAVIQCPNEVFISGCPAILPVIREGNFASYLFKGQEVRSIAVDGADRKWIATSSGAWLISPDGDKVIEHYTEDNSPLLSSDVKSITIDGSNGEVFFGTAKGISSFRGSATEAAETISNVKVFPNPVPPGFNGNIGIRGLPENSWVKITELNGRLVFQTRALGGQAIWNGKDYRGKQASSGVYLVLSLDDAKQEKVVTKIVFVSR